MAILFLREKKVESCKLKLTFISDKDVKFEIKDIKNNKKIVKDGNIENLLVS